MRSKTVCACTLLMLASCTQEASQKPASSVAPSPAVVARISAAPSRQPVAKRAHPASPQVPSSDSGDPDSDDAGSEPEIAVQQVICDQNTLANFAVAAATCSQSEIYETETARDLRCRDAFERFVTAHPNVDCAESSQVTAYRIRTSEILEEIAELDESLK